MRTAHLASTLYYIDIQSGEMKLCFSQKYAIKCAAAACNSSELTDVIQTEIVCLGAQFSAAPTSNPIKSINHILHK